MHAAPPSVQVSKSTLTTDSSSTYTDTMTSSSSSVAANALTDSIDSALERAQAWLTAQRASDWSWRNDTPIVTLALQMSGVGSPVGTGNVGSSQVGATPNGDEVTLLESQLAAKQMEVEVVILLWR